MSETNLSHGTETSDESSGSGDGDNDDDQIPVIGDRNPEYHESQQCHEYIDQVLNYISIPQSGGAFCRNQSYSSTSSLLSTVSTSNQNSAHQVTGSTNHSSNRMVCKVFTLTSLVEKVWIFLN